MRICNLKLRRSTERKTDADRAQAATAIPLFQEATAADGPSAGEEARFASVRAQAAGPTGPACVMQLQGQACDCRYREEVSPGATGRDAGVWD